MQQPPQQPPAAKPKENIKMFSVGKPEYTDIPTNDGAVAKSKDGYRFVVLRRLINDTNPAFYAPSTLEWSKFSLVSGRTKYPVDSATQLYSGAFSFKIYSGQDTSITLVFQVPIEKLSDLTFRYDINSEDYLLEKLD